MKKVSKNKDLFTLTLKGLLSINHPAAFAEIERYMKLVESNAIVFENCAGGEFTNVEKNV